MIGPLLVAVAHGLDLVTFGLAVERYGLSGEWGPLAAIFGLGLPAVVAAKLVGGAAAAWIVHRVGRWTALAAGAGIVGAASNTWALAL